mgnify:CR=1 FL=1
MEQVEGYVEQIRFRNEENGYTVLTLLIDGEDETCVGNFSYINEGEYIVGKGEWVEHPVHGPQFQMTSFETKVPTDTKGMERYLGSGAIKGVGPVLAARIVKAFGKDTFRIIEEEPERLSEIKGITEKKAREIGIIFSEKQEMRQAMMFLAEYGIATNYAVKIYKEYGDDLYEVVKTNPYQLAEDITGIGFKIADEIARRVGIGSDSDFRIKSGILYALLQGVSAGHTYLPVEQLVRDTAHLLQVPEDGVRMQLSDLAMERKLVIKKEKDQDLAYGAQFYYLELNSAARLLDLNLPYEVEERELNHAISSIEKETKIELDELQKDAIKEAARNGVLVITGGPGTGKTTTINAIIKYFEGEGLDIMLAAPTGRAAKRMTEATGYDAQTIHRLLEINGDIEGDSRFRFERNEQNPIETDVVIIDEMSMVDISLLHALVSAIVPGTRLIMVGDVNQLPSVGAGNVLKDLISSHAFRVVRLNKIFRQEEQSAIVVNAHKINAGQMVPLDNKNMDFFFLKRDDANTIIGVMIYLIREKLPKFVNATMFDIQVLTPMRKGELGVERLNTILQQYLNPADGKKREKEVGHTIFREGDKVMQIKNNYKLAWEVKSQAGYVIEEGVGVFNGDMGRVKTINTFAEELTVQFDDGRLVTYGFSMLDELELSYAITIHKAQGSEYEAVVMPLLTGPRVLFSRNLLYTGVTRAKQCVTLIGNDKTVEFMIQNNSEQKRYSSLEKRIRELSGMEVEKEEFI